MYPSSGVHTGVKSLGCENKMAQPSPIHSWKLIVPCEVSAVKLGASSFMRSMHCPPEAEALYIGRSQPIHVHGIKSRRYGQCHHSTRHIRLYRHRLGRKLLPKWSAR